MQNLTYSFLIIAGRSWLLKHFMYFLRDWVGVGVEGWGGGRECRAERGQCGPGEAGQLQLVPNIPYIDNLVIFCPRNVGRISPTRQRKMLCMLHF